LYGEDETKLYIPASKSKWLFLCNHRERHRLENGISDWVERNRLGLKEFSRLGLSKGT
jgi:hypothetical protein